MHFSAVPALIPGTRYTVRESILSVYRRDDQYIFLKIPAGEEVTIVGEEPGTPFTLVRWQFELLQIFALDLQDRGEPTNSFAPPGDLSSYVAASV